MSLLKKKFITDNAVGSAEILLENNSALRARNAADSANVDLIKLNGSDQAQIGAQLNMGGFAISNVGNVDGRDVSADGSTLDGHLDGGANKHDASELDFEDTAASAKNLSAGSVESALTSLDDAIGDLTFVPTNYSDPANDVVADHLSAIDDALASAGSSEFSDANFRIQDDVDATKEIAFEASGISTGTVRTVTMPDANVDLLDVNNAILKDGSRNFTANQSMNNNKLTDLAAPTADNDAARKVYVDSIAAGLRDKAEVKVATDSALPANTASGSGVGKTLTADANGALSVDGVSTFTDIDNDGGANDPFASGTKASRVLVKDESTGANNGIYAVKDKGSGATPWILVRAIDADEDSEVSAGMTTFASEGTVNGNQRFALVTDNPITVDTTALNFTRISSLGQVTAGAGLSKSGETLSVNVGDGIAINSDNVEAVAADLAGSGLEDDGSNNLRIAGAAAGAGLTGGGGSPLAVNVDDSTIEIATDVVQVKASGITATQIATSVAGDGIAGGGGAALSVDLAASPGLEISAAKLKAKVDGVTVTINGSGALEGLKPNREKFTLTSTDITNGFIDLAQEAKNDTIHFMVQGAVPQFEGIDYTLSVVGGVTRITFAGDLAAGGDAALEANDVVHVQYFYL